jgi:hypothetical protein
VYCARCGKAHFKYLLTSNGLFIKIITNLKLGGKKVNEPEDTRRTDIS